MSIDTTHPMPSTDLASKQVLTDDLQIQMVAIYNSDNPLWLMKGPLKSLRPEKERLADEFWDRRLDRTDDKYHYAPLYLRDSYSVIIFQRKDKEEKNLEFGIGLLDCDLELFIESDVDKIMQWVCPDDAAYEEQVVALGHFHAIIDNARRLANCKSIETDPLDS